MKINYLIIAFIVGLFVLKTQAQVITYTDNFTTSVSADWTVVNGTWTVTGGVLQSNTTAADPKKLLLTKSGYNLVSSTPQQIVAKVRVDSWVGGSGSEDRAGVCLISTTDTDGSHRGYSFLLRPNNKVTFLSDKLAWYNGDANAGADFTWSTGIWYWMKLKIETSTLSGKIWKDGDSEPGTWTITQALSSGNWNLLNGYPGMVGSAVTGTGVSYDDVTVSAPSASVADPTTFTATPTGSSQIDLSWVRNGNSNNVMVAWNSFNTFGTPTGPYTVGNSITDGGTVIYNGSGTTYNHTGLTPSTPYYYKAWSVDGTTYSVGVTANATTAAAAVIRYVTPNGDGNNDGTSWSNAYPGAQLQTAIDASGVTQVWVKAGTYKPTTETDRTVSFRMKNNVAIYGGFAGTETLLSQRNVATNETFLSGDLNGDDNYSTVPAGNNSENTYHVVYNPQQDPVINNTAILDGFTIRGGNANGGMNAENGGGIYNNYSSPAITNVTVSNNSATSKGGGFYNFSSSSPTLTNVTVNNNLASFGGGFYNDGSSPILINVTISNNSAQYGGGFYNDGSSPTLSNSIVWGNTASVNYFQFYTSNGTATLNYSCYSNGTNDNEGSLTTNNCITTNPKFVDATNIDFRLYGNSPCVNYGFNDYNTEDTDIRGQARIQNTTIDMGAYEWTSGVDPAYLEVRRYVTQAGDGSKNGTSWANAYDNTQLQTAIDETGVTDVWVAAGTYKPTTGTNRTISFRMKNNVAIYGGFAGTETLLSERNVATNVTILSGDLNGDDDYSSVPSGNNTENTYHVVYNPDQNPDINSTAVLDGFTIQGGKGNDEITGFCGGGIYNDHSSPKFTNVTVSNNSASSVGGGIYNYYSSPTLTNVSVSNNFAPKGGGIFNLSSAPSLINVTVCNNFANFGGGFYDQGSSPTLSNCIVWGNIISSSGKQFYVDEGTMTLNYSCYADGDGDVSLVYGGSIIAAHCITTDPKFADAVNGDLRICGNSPCKDHGLNTYNVQTTDIRGQARIQNTTIDLGAYEWTSGLDPAYLEVRRYVTTSGGAVTKDGTSWENAYPGDKLQTAIGETGVTDVWVAAGTYNPVDLSKGGSTRSSFFQMKNNVAIYGGFAGTETLLSQRNVATNVTILSGDLSNNDNFDVQNGGYQGITGDDNCYHVVYNPDLTPDINSTAVLDGFTIRGGNANGFMNAANGGGIYNDYSSPTITNVTISNNSADYGGGIYNINSSPTITNVKVSNNSAISSFGGGICNYSSSPTISNATISNNSATYGGGIFNYASSPTLNNCIVWGNTASLNGHQFFIIESGTTTANYSCYSNGTNDVFPSDANLSPAHCITTDPQFIDATNSDFRIYGNSPCVNTGNNSYNTQPTDIRGQARIQNTTIDMGAYEWTSGLDPEGVVTPTAQPTNLQFSNSVSVSENNIIVNFTASASAESYLVIRRSGAVPTFSPVDGTAYTAGTTQGDSYIVYSGTAVTATDANLSAGTYYYKIFAFNGSGAGSKYLITAPLAGSTVFSTTSQATVGNTTGSTSGAGFPAAGVAITFPNGTSGTSLTVTKTNTVPASNFAALPGVRGMKNLYFTIESNPESPGSYTLVLDFSSLTGMTEAKWNTFKIMKRADATEAWKDVTAAPYLATIANRQTDAIWGKFTITGLNSFSEFGGGEGNDTWTVTSVAETGAGTLKQLIADAAAGDIITFNTTSMGGSAITLSSVIEITKDLTIRGVDFGITLDGNNTTMVMQIADAQVVRLEKLIIQNGFGEVSYAGGIWNNGDLTMVNCVVSGNKETGTNGVGGILQFSEQTKNGDDPNDVLNLINCTISENDGDSGFNHGIGGLSSTGGIVKIHNSIIYRNTGDGNTDVDETMTIYESYHSCIGNLTSLTITLGSGNISNDPLFAGVAKNRKYYYYSIQSGSSCKDAGYNESNFETTDIRGQSRVYNSTVDMGAYEWYTGDSYSDLTWDGSAGTDWATAANWTPAKVPSADYNVILENKGEINWPIVAGTPGSPSECHNLTIGTDAAITIPAGKALTVNGTLINDQGNTGLIIQSNATGTGSLIHNSDDVGASIERYITGNSNILQRAYHQVAVPLESDALLSGLFINSYLYRYDVANQNWVGLGTSTTTPLDKNQGYLIYYPGANTTYSFEGNLRNGTITLFSSAGLTDNHFLVPNPYPSAIDWDALSGWTKTNLYDAIWIWNPVAKNYAAYGTEAGTNGATRYIPQGQAFFVRAEAAGATLELNNSTRVHSSQAFFKSGNAVENMLRIAATANDGRDEAIIRFRPDANSSLDNLDVAKFFGDEEAPQLYTLADENVLSINSLPMQSDLVEVPVNFETQFTGQVTLNFEGLESFDPSLKIYLKDELTNQTINLRNQPVYTFNHNPENAASRFKLVFNGTIGIEEPANLPGNMWITGNTLYINAPNLTGQTGLVEVYNASGQKLMSKTMVLSEISTMELNFKGFVVARLTAGNEVMTVKGVLR